MFTQKLKQILLIFFITPIRTASLKLQNELELSKKTKPQLKKKLYLLRSFKPQPHVTGSYKKIIV